MNSLQGLPETSPAHKSQSFYCTSAATHFITALAIGILVGAGIAYASYLLTSIGLTGSICVGVSATLVTGLASYVILHYILAKKEESRIKPDPKPKEIVTRPRTKDINMPIEQQYLEEVRKYSGDLTKSEKEHIHIKETASKQLDISFTQYPSFHFSIRYQNLFQSGAQVIVNAANTHLGGGGGIDGAIHSAGGPAYAKAHQSLQTKYQSKYVEGYAACIESGELKQKYNIDNVIVVAGPQPPNSVKKENALYSCYYNSLVLAHEQKKTSIAFPAISTGIFHYPPDRAAAISLKAVYDFVQTYPESPLKTISIHFLKQPNPDFYKQALTG